MRLLACVCSRASARVRLLACVCSHVSACSLTAALANLLHRAHLRTVWYVLHLTDEISIDIGPSPATAATSAPADTDAAETAAAAAIAEGMPPGLPSSRSHVLGGSPLPYTMRARAQRLHFLGYERLVRAGEVVELSVQRSSTQLAVNAVPPTEATARGAVVAWPLRNSLGYHFSMIADTTRNRCFDRAIVAALAGRQGAS